MPNQSKNSTENHFYEHRKQFIFSEIDAAWRKNQFQQIEEINKCDFQKMLWN